MGNLRARALQGSVWTIVEYLVNNLLRLASNLVLAHTLFPEAFALVAYASIVIQGLDMFSDIGIGPAIVQSSRGSDPLFLNTAWTFQIIRGWLLFLLTLFLGWPMAWFYNEPQLALIIPACGLNFIVSGLQSTAVHTCSRSLALGRLTAWGITETVLKAIITITWAWFWPSVWAIVGGAFISYTIGMILTHTILPGIRNTLCWERSAVSTLMRFGGWISLSTMFTFIAGQADRLMLGKLVAMGVVGVYSIALMFARLPYEIGSRLAQSVLFPALADVARNDREALRAKFLKSRDAILAICQLGTVVLLVGSPWFFRLIYDERYIDAAIFAPLLAGTAWFSILQITADRALLALGNARVLALSNFINLSVTISACLIGFHFDQLRGFIIGLGLGNFSGHAVIAWALTRHGISIVRQDFLYTMLVTIASLIGLSATMLVDGINNTYWTLILAVVGVSVSAFIAYRRLEFIIQEKFQSILNHVRRRG